MKVLIINDTTDWYHFGCTGTSLALKNEIEKLGHTVCLFSIMERSKLICLPESIDDFFNQGNLVTFISHNNEFSELVKTCDIVIVNGEGTLHGIKNGPLSLLYIIYVAKNIFSKHVQIINHSAYPNDTESTEDTPASMLYKRIYNDVDFVAVREPVSATIMRQFNIEITESFDCLPLYIKHCYPRGLKTSKSNIILLSGTAAWFNLNIFTTAPQPSNEIKSGLYQIINILKHKIAEGYEIKFLFSSISHPAKDDQEMMHFLSENMGENLQIIYASNINEWLKHIEEAKLLISGRFHHSIAAACLGTNFIALNSNTPKILGLMQAIGHEEPLLYSNKNLTESLYKKINSKLTAKDPSNALLDDLCLKAQNNFNLLRKLKAAL